MTLSLDLDALEICWCKRLICNDDLCDIKARLLADMSTVEPPAAIQVPPDAPTPAEWTAMQGRWPVRVTDRRQRDRGAAA